MRAKVLRLSLKELSHARTLKGVFLGFIIVEQCEWLPQQCKVVTTPKYFCANTVNGSPNNVIVGCFLRGLQSPTETHCGQVRAQARNWRSLRRPKGLLLNAPPSIHFSPSAIHFSTPSIHFSSPSIHFAVSAPHFDSFFSGN